MIGLFSHKGAAGLVCCSLWELLEALIQTRHNRMLAVVRLVTERFMLLSDAFDCLLLSYTWVSNQALIFFWMFPAWEGTLSTETIS